LQTMRAGYAPTPLLFVGPCVHTSYMYINRPWWIYRCRSRRKNYVNGLTVPCVLLLLFIDTNQS
jgi:hypothetical protein